MHDRGEGEGGGGVYLVLTSLLTFEVKVFQCKDFNRFTLVFEQLIKYSILNHYDKVIYKFLQ